MAKGGTDVSVDEIMAMAKTKVVLKSYAKLIRLKPVDLI